MKDLYLALNEGVPDQNRSDKEEYSQNGIYQNCLHPNQHLFLRVARFERVMGFGFEYLHLYAVEEGFVL